MAEPHAPATVPASGSDDRAAVPARPMICLVERVMVTPLVSVAQSSSDRVALAGGLTFLEGSAAPEWEGRDLRAWFSEHLVAPGCMTMPFGVTEPSVGTVALYGRSPAPPQSLRRIVVAARDRVLAALRGLTASPVDDRFVAATIFAGWVWRQRVQGVNQWRPRPQPTTPLSGVVLSLFAVDVLSHREIYDQLLSVCDTCDRVTFREGARRSCREHEPHVSGLIRKARHPGGVLGDESAPIHLGAQSRHTVAG